MAAVATEGPTHQGRGGRGVKTCKACGAEHPQTGPFCLKCWLYGAEEEVQGDTDPAILPSTFDSHYEFDTGFSDRRITTDPRGHN